jgi:hypothetical protein
MRNSWQPSCSSQRPSYPPTCEAAVTGTTATPATAAPSYSSRGRGDPLAGGFFPPLLKRILPRRRRQQMPRRRHHPRKTSSLGPRLTRSRRSS